MAVSMHRALAHAMNADSPKADAASTDAHASAVGRLQKVTMPQPPKDNTVKPELKPVSLGRDTSSTGMNFTQPSESMDNLVTSK